LKRLIEKIERTKRVGDVRKRMKASQDNYSKERLIHHEWLSIHNKSIQQKWYEDKIINNRTTEHKLRIKQLYRKLKDEKRQEMMLMDLQEKSFRRQEIVEKWKQKEEKNVSLSKSIVHNAYEDQIF